jgi:hypothetical protein
MKISSNLIYICIYENSFLKQYHNYLLSAHLKGLEVGLVEEDGKQVDPELGVVQPTHYEGLGPREAHLPLDIRVGVVVRHLGEHESLGDNLHGFFWRWH